MGNKTIAIDFDGVIAEYDPPMGFGNLGKPIAGAKEGMERLVEMGWTIIVYTTRLETNLIKQYLEKNGIIYDHINYNPRNEERDLHALKTSADIYVDDRGIQFRGNWKNLLEEVKNFKEWWKKD